MGRSGSVEQRAAYRAAAGALAAMLISGAASAQPASAPSSAPASADVPATTAESDILRWVATRTSIPRAAVLMLEPRAVVALAGETPATAGSLAHADVREELIAADSKVRSAMFSVDLDCAGRRFRIISRKTYALPDLKGEAQANLEPGPWSAVNEGAPVAKAWAAVCTSNFNYPYGPRAIVTAPPVQRAAAPPAPAPLPTPRPAPARKLVAAAPPTPAPPAAPAPAAGGDYEAVLGAYTVKDNAVAASDKLDRVLGGRMAGRHKALVSATVKGKVYTVLTVSGFATPADASSFCSAAKSIPLACIVKKGG